MQPADGTEWADYHRSSSSIPAGFSNPLLNHLRLQRVERVQRLVARLDAGQVNSASDDVEAKLDAGRQLARAICAVRSPAQIANGLHQLGFRGRWVHGELEALDLSGRVNVCCGSEGRLRLGHGILSLLPTAFPELTPLLLQNARHELRNMQCTWGAGDAPLWIQEENTSGSNQVFWGPLLLLPNWIPKKVVATYASTTPASFNSVGLPIELFTPFQVPYPLVTGLGTYSITWNKDGIDWVAAHPLTLTASPGTKGLRFPAPAHDPFRPWAVMLVAQTLDIKWVDVGICHVRRGDLAFGGPTRVCDKCSEPTTPTPDPSPAAL